ncbi:MAG: HAD-IA family hydrolase [Dehalococcoidales bacterium]|nr:HAD-IA family hydrolase [Dehalococcoidales bacterium]
MTSTKPTIIWDFDGTLVYFASWRIALMDALDEYEPGHGVDEEQIRPFLKDGFPWHRPDEPHTHLNTPEAWWTALEPFFIGAYRGVGLKHERSCEIAGQVRKHMCDPQRYTLYEDTMLTLATLKEKGWRHIILSNHMPELPDVIRSLGLTRYIDMCFTSAVIGYEKPNLQAFRIALEGADYPETVWMIGDNPVSDVKGATAAGIPAILVHNQPAADTRYYVENLLDVVKIIEENTRI